MRREAHPLPSVWLRAALVATARPMRTGATPPVGWTFRAASPKWFCTWRSRPEALRRLRAVVLPEPWRGQDAGAWRTLRLDQLRRLGLTNEGPSGDALRQGEQRLMSRLAKPWGRTSCGEDHEQT